MFVFVLIAGGGAFAVSLLLTWLVRGVARRTDFVDRPSGHKQHNKPVALGGGIAIAATILMFIVGGTAAAWWLRHVGPPNWTPSFLLAHLPGIASKLPAVLALGGGILILHVVGLIDDIRPMSWGIKLIIQALVAFVIAGPVGIRAVEFLPTPFPIFATVVWIVLVTNAFNFLDNTDGLSAGVAGIACAIFAVASASAGQIFVPVMAWVGAGACLGYLAFNFPPASIFMGDAGSLVIGFFLAVLTILTNYYDAAVDPTPLGVIVPLIVLAIPLYDAISVISYRLHAGQSPFHGDRRHFSHRLMNRGMTVRGTVLTIYLATAATGLPAILLPRLTWAGAILVLLQCLCVVAIIAILESTKVIHESRITEAASSVEGPPPEK